MPAQSPHTNTTLVVRHIRSLVNCQNQQQRGAWRNYQFPCAERHVSFPAGDWDSSQGGSSVFSTIQVQNSTRSSSLNNSRVADLTQLVTSTPSARMRRSIHPPTTTPGTCSSSTPPPGGPLQRESTRCIAASPASSIGSTPTPLSGYENLPTPIPNPESHVIITNPLRMQATEKNQRQRLWQLHRFKGVDDLLARLS